jgi:hypothetical protein
MKVYDIISEVKLPGSLSKALDTGLEKIGATLFGRTNKGQAFDNLVDAWSKKRVEAVKAGYDPKTVKMDPELEKIAGGFAKSDPAFIAKADERAMQAAEKAAKERVGGLFGKKKKKPAEEPNPADVKNTKVTTEIKTKVDGLIGKAWGGLGTAINAYGFARPIYTYYQQVENIEDWYKKGQLPPGASEGLTLDQWRQQAIMEQRTILISTLATVAAGGAIARYGVSMIYNVVTAPARILGLGKTATAIGKAVKVLGQFDKNIAVVLLADPKNARAIAEAVAFPVMDWVNGDAVRNGINSLKDQLEEKASEEGGDENKDVANTSDKGQAGQTAPEQWIPYPADKSMLYNPKTGDVKPAF